MLLILVVVLISLDFYSSKKKKEKNPYEYSLKNLRHIEDSLICYSEIKQINTEIEKLKGITIDKQDRIFVSGDNKVIVFKRNGKMESSFITENNPECIAVAEDGLIYLGMRDHVEVWNDLGDLKRTWETINDKVVITSIAVKNNSVFVADAGNRLVYHYNLQGQLINNIEGTNDINGVRGFIIPSPYFDVIAGREDQIWIANTGMHTLEAYKPNGELISSWTRSSMQIDGFSGCCNPSHFALLSNGFFVTSEKGLERVKIHYPSGEFRCVVAAPEMFEEGTVGLDIAVDSDDLIHVIDPKKGLIRIFKERGNWMD